jgi:hypothetical protein
MKQTAVEWLAKNLKDFPHIKHSQSFKELIKQAKEMEKQQIIESYCQGCFDISKDESIFPRETSEKNI